MDLKREIREVQDYPKEGISFKDVTTLFKNPDALNFAINEIVLKFKDKKITKVLGLEARGFIMGGAVAGQLGAGFIPVRKEGKLPFDTIKESYELEYGSDTIEIHKDALCEDDVVLIHDDLLATGGTAHAALKLTEQSRVKQVYFSFLCDLEFIETPQKGVIQEFDPHILIKY